MNLKQSNDRQSRTFTIERTYEELVEALGQPEDVSESSDKMDVEWCVGDKKGRVFNVWNYKNGKNYLGENGTPVTEIERWSAGGSWKLAHELGLVELEDEE